MATFWTAHIKVEPMSQMMQAIKSESRRPIRSLVQEENNEPSREPPAMDAVIPPWATESGLLKYSLYYSEGMVSRDPDIIIQWVQAQLLSIFTYLVSANNGRHAGDIVALDKATNGRQTTDEVDVGQFRPPHCS